MSTIVRINSTLEPRRTPTTNRSRSRPTTPVEPDESRETVDTREPVVPEPPADQTREKIQSVASTVDYRRTAHPF